MIYIVIALAFALAITFYAANRRIRIQEVQLDHLEAHQQETNEAYSKEVGLRNSANVELKLAQDRVEVLEREKAELDEECDALQDAVDEMKSRLGEYQSYQDLKMQCAGLTQQVNMLSNIRERSQVEINELTELLDQQKKANLGSVPVTDWVVGTTALARYIKRNAKQTRQLLQNDPAFPAYFANVGANKIWDRKLVDRWLEQVGV